MTSYFRNASDELQRFEGPSLDQPDTPEWETEILQAKCEELLKTFDLHSERKSTDRLGFARVCDDESDRLFVVPLDIDYECLRSILSYAAKQYELGQTVGAANAKSTILRALGAQPIPASDY
jgi:hypothetical protein